VAGALPSFAVAVLNGRRKRPFVGQQQTTFASCSGTLRDPENFNTAWRAVRDELGMPEVTSHSFRKTVATLIDMSRGRVHDQVAGLLDRTVTDMNDE